MDLHRAHLFLTTAQRGMELAAQVRRSPYFEHHFKGEGPNRSLVTVPDVAIQVIWTKMLRAQPHPVQLLAEEDLHSLNHKQLVQVARLVGLPLVEVIWLLTQTRFREGKPFDILDPIDGTEGFARGLFYALLWGRCCNQKVQEAFLYSPHTPVVGESGVTNDHPIALWAERGLGVVEWNGCCWQPLATPTVPKRKPIILVGRINHKDSHHWQDRVIEKLGGVSQSIHSAVKYAMIARGEADLMLSLPKPKSVREVLSHDHSSMLFVEAKGGRMTDAFGKPYRFIRRTLGSSRGLLVARTPELHRMAIDAIWDTQPSGWHDDPRSWRS